jgi:hypothetical protein
MLRSPLLVVALAAAAGCAAKTAPTPSSPQAPSAVNGGESPSAATTEAKPPLDGSSPAATPGEPGTSSDTTQLPGEPPPGTPSLPAVSVKTIGLHVGGGPNDATGKAPFVSALEQRFPEFLRCYRLVAEPGKGGSFGVDLHIERNGGHARVEQPRSALEGEPFRACMVSAFEGVEFPQLKKPFVVSYSLRFLVEP